MTRVEKFHTYREEIANMKIDQPVLHRMNQKNVIEIKQKTLVYRPSFNQIIYCVIGMSVILTLLLLVMFVK